MRHIYQIDSDRGMYWEVYKDNPENSYIDYFMRDLQDQNEFDLYLDFLREWGVDFVIHTLEEYDEYHVALPAV